MKGYLVNPRIPKRSSKTVTPLSEVASEVVQIRCWSKDSFVPPWQRIYQSKRAREASKEAANTIIMALPLETLKYASVGDLGALASINSSAARRRVEERDKKQ